MVAKRGKFTELANCHIGAKRSVVISSLEDDSFTIGQQLEVEEDGCTTNIFLKGAFHVDSIEGLCNLRDALTEAIRIADVW